MAITTIPEWSANDDQTINAIRHAEFWQHAENGAIDCTLCYRECHIEDGQAGWCRGRVNEGGRMAIPHHGVASVAGHIRLGYGTGSLCYYPGARALTIGGIYCTSGCSFCSAQNVTWNPKRLPWANGERKLGTTSGWNRSKAMLHPAGAVGLARRWGFSQIVIWENEPLLTIEYTADVAMLARAAGMGVSVYTNGFSTPAAIKRLAPYVNAVNIGVKGSLDPAFYATHMRAEGATPHVQRSILEWMHAGKHVTISDVLPPPHLQTRAAAESAWSSFYGWLASEARLVPLMLVGMHPPGEKCGTPLMPRETTPELWADRDSRPADACAAAQRAGLPYAHDGHVIRCHHCQGLLLDFAGTVGEQNWSHEQHVTNGCCDHCGGRVPIWALSTQQLERATSAAYEAAQARANPFAIQLFT